MRTRNWVGLFLACAITANAQPVPYSFNYQGVLRGGSGEPLEPPLQRTVEFRLYDSASEGTLLWGRTYMVQLSTNGLFNVELSDAGTQLTTLPHGTQYESLKDSIASGSEIYLGLTVEGSAEIAPRQKLLAVPFAMMAGDVRSTTGDLLVNGTLEATKGVHVNGTISATTSLQVGSGASMATLTATDTGALSVHKLDVTDGLTVDGSTVVSDMTANGVVSLFSRKKTPFDDPAWLEVTNNEKILHDKPASSDGFIIINFKYDLNTNAPGDYNMIEFAISFTGAHADRIIVHGFLYDNVDAKQIVKYDVVTLPVLKGETVKMKKPTAYDLKSGTEIKVRAVFIPFGVNL